MGNCLEIEQNDWEMKTIDQVKKEVKFSIKLIINIFLTLNFIYYSKNVTKKIKFITKNQEIMMV